MIHYFLHVIHLAFSEHLWLVQEIQELIGISVELFWPISYVVVSHGRREWKTRALCQQSSTGVQ